MVSTESGHKSSKSRSSKNSSSRRVRHEETYLNTHYDLPRSVFQGRSKVVGADPVYDVVRNRDDQYENLAGRRTTTSLYQNLDDIYDHPRGPAFVQSHYENMNFNEEEEDHTYFNLKDHSTYDVPRSKNEIYDQPRVDHDPTTIYDLPKNLVPLSARLLLDARQHGILTDNSTENDRKDCDADSLDENREPTPDYPHETEELMPDSRAAGPSPDEGIGELDIKGLDIIVEETEEESSLSSPIYSDHSTSRGPLRQQLRSLTRSCDDVTSYKSRRDKGLQCENLRNHKGESSESDTASTASISTEDDMACEKNHPTVTESPKSCNETDEQERIQKDRCIEVYHETLRQRNCHKNKTGNLAMFQVTSAKEDAHNLSTIRRMKKLLPSVKALRSQFELKSAEISSRSECSAPVRKWKSSSSFKETPDMERSRSRSSSLGSLDEISSSSSSGTSSKFSTHSTTEQPSIASTISTVSLIQPIAQQFQNLDHDMYKPRHSTAQWDPTSLLEELYRLEEPLSKSVGNDKENNQCVLIEGYLDKLPSGRRKATFWNAWKRRFFKAKEGYLYHYQNNQSDKPSLVLQLIGGNIENIDNNMIGVDDGKGHYMVIRGTSKAETERWYHALLTHVNYNANAIYIQPWPMPQDPNLLKDVLIIDLGSTSIRAGVLSTQPTLPQVFFPSVAAVDKSNGSFVAFGNQALLPDIRAKSNLTYPIRPSSKISKYMMDLDGVTGLIRSAIQQLNVNPSEYHIQVSVPRHLNHSTQAELLHILFSEFKVQSVNLTHQSVLSLLSYNASSGIVVDVGERIDIVPVMDGYILQSSVSQVPYGGQQLLDHLRHFLVQQKCSLITEVESFIIRYILEKLAYVAGPDVGGYSRELARAKHDSSTVRASVELSQFNNGHLPWDTVSLELGRFQVTEGLFHPEAWGLDNPGIPRLIHKAIQDCSVDIRKEMVRSIYLSGGVTLLPGFAERLEAEVDRLTPEYLKPKVHASPFRYHASYIGGCILANSPAFTQSKISRQEWESSGSQIVRKWKI